MSFPGPQRECVWQHNFPSFASARRIIGARIRWYNEEWPHQSLGWLSPAWYQAQQPKKVGRGPGGLQVRQTAVAKRLLGELLGVEAQL